MLAEATVSPGRSLRLAPRTILQRFPHRSLLASFVAPSAAMTSRPITLSVNDPLVDHVSAVVHRPERQERQQLPSVLLAPGAGGDLEGAGLTALAEVIASAGSIVVRANLPYREAGRRPPRADRAVDSYLAVLAAAQDAVGDRRPWVLGGKSYGGRVASLAVAAGHEAVGLLFYGYPLHPPGKPAQLRVDHWPDVDVPTLFLQGERDTFSDRGLLVIHLRKLPRRATLHMVAGGDHSLRVAAKHSPTGEAIPEGSSIWGCSAVVAGWLRGLET